MSRDVHVFNIEPKKASALKAKKEGGSSESRFRIRSATQNPRKAILGVRRLTCSYKWDDKRVYIYIYMTSAISLCSGMFATICLQIYSPIIPHLSRNPKVCERRCGPPSSQSDCVCVRRITQCLDHHAALAKR